MTASPTMKKPPGFRLEIDASTTEAANWLYTTPKGVTYFEDDPVPKSKSKPSGKERFYSDYEKERRLIVSAFKKQGLRNDKLGIFTLTWLAHYERLRAEEFYGVRGVEAVFAKLLESLVICYNEYGQEFTAYRYRFGPQHNFDWLPKSGEIKKLDRAYRPALRRVQRVPKHLLASLDEHLIKRHLRLTPSIALMRLARPPKAKPKSQIE